MAGSTVHFQLTVGGVLQQIKRRIKTFNPARMNTFWVQTAVTVQLKSVSRILLRGYSEKYILLKPFPHVISYYFKDESSLMPLTLKAHCRAEFYVTVSSSSSLYC